MEIQTPTDQVPTLVEPANPSVKELSEPAVITTGIKDGGLEMATPNYNLFEYGVGTSMNITELVSRRHEIAAFQVGPNGTTYYEDVVDRGWLFLKMPSLEQRLKGVAGFKVSLRFTVEVLQEPHSSGSVRLSFQPMAGQAGYDRSVTHAGRFQLPSVVLDYSNANMVTLEVEHCHVLDYIPMSIAKLHEPKLGKLCLAQEHFHSAIDSSTLAGHMYVQVTKLEVVGSAAPIDGTTNLPLVLGPALGAVLPATQAGIGVVGKEMQQEAKGGVISTVVSGLAQTARMVSPLIPGIAGPIIGATSWGLQLLAGGLRAFGYSEPQVTATPTKCWVLQEPNVNNCNNPGLYHNLGAMADNYVAVSADLGDATVEGNADPMAMDYVLTKPGLLTRGQWTNTTVRGNALYAVPLSPMAMYYRSASNDVGSLPLVRGTFNPNSASFIEMAPVGYFSQMFRNFRGGFRFRLKVCATKYHRGRLALVFQPAPKHDHSTTFDMPFITNGRIDDATMICDISEQCEFVFDTPYQSPTPYTKVEDAFGMFYVMVYDKLAGPAVVAPTVGYTLSVEALTGFELAGPTTPWMPLSPSVVSGDYQFVKKVDQSGGVVQMMPAEFTHGEYITSLKQLLMLPQRWGLNHVEESRTVIGSKYIFPLPSWSDVQTTELDFSPGYQAGKYALTYHNLISVCYLFWRGGTVYCATNTEHHHTMIRICSSRDRAGQADRVTAENCSNTIVSGAMDMPYAKLPYYSNTVKSVACITEPGYNNIDGYLQPSAYAEYIAGVQNQGLTIKAADDAQLGMWLGVPPLTLPCWSSDGYRARIDFVFTHG